MNAHPAQPGTGIGTALPPAVYRVEPAGQEFPRGGYHAAREAASRHSYRTRGDASVETLDERGEVVPGGRVARFNKGGPVERYPGTASPP